MQKLYYCLFIFIGTLGLQAQDVLWQKNIKSSTQDFLAPISLTIDGQYLVSGSSIQASKLSSVGSAGGASQNNGYDYHLIKLNQQGQPLWEKYFAGNKHDYLSASVSTQEGGFLLAGTSWSSKGLDKTEDSFGGSDIWLIKVDENGTQEWQKTIGTPYNEEAVSAVQTTDLGYFVAGNVSNSKDGFGSKDALIIKMDQSGKLTNEIILGGKGLDEVQKMIPTKDGGCLIGIYSRSGLTEKPIDVPKSENAKAITTPLKRIAKQTDNYGQGDYWIVKLDKNGNVQWEKNYGGTEDDHIKTLINTSTGYIIGGESRSKSSGNKTAGLKEGTDLWMIALRENGDELWQKSYNFKNRDILMSMNGISDGTGNKTKGFLIGGYTQAEEKVEKNDETFWMLYCDLDGNEVWRKYIEGKSKQKEERLVDALLNRDGTYVLAGTSAEELGQENWKIVKLGDKQIEDLVEKQDIKIYPNPVSEYCYVEIGLDFKEAEIALYDTSGRMVQSLKTKNTVTKINTSNLPQGIYVVTAKTETKTVNDKLIKK
ncbi:Por secretion system C-terminal sorting domain-containing protein [Halpernia humi]|uniref:Por secretion system C-terminal sorting domain-containing protein n=1 Tax=Halpernia humi TaxID=493375 RepID=A0A1H5ZQQ6_9FLAO|nr:T9SS type A sorting domain-containing protein [Halpernia humi]SEG38500.1 Por secretion system C-terminal sorting domain-containing protein [Halpernia humi]